MASNWVEHRDEEAQKQRWFNLELGIVISLSERNGTPPVVGTLKNRLLMGMGV